METSFGEELDLHADFTSCTKNPGHADFVPVKKLSLDLLPEEIRSTENLFKIKTLAVRTVKLTVRYVSTQRPPGYHLHDKAGRHAVSVGSGFVEAVDVVDSDLKLPCPFDDCKEHPEAQSHSVYGYITVVTAAHLVFDDEEARNTTVEFFYDSSDDKSGIIIARGVKIQNVNREKDYCQLLCTTHEQNLIYFLRIVSFFHERQDLLSFLHNRIKLFDYQNVCIKKQLQFINAIIRTVYKNRILSTSVVDVLSTSFLPEFLIETYGYVLEKVDQIYSLFSSLVGNDIEKAIIQCLPEQVKKIKMSSKDIDDFLQTPETASTMHRINVGGYFLDLDRIESYLTSKESAYLCDHVCSSVCHHLGALLGDNIASILAFFFARSLAEYGLGDSVKKESDYPGLEEDNEEEDNTFVEENPYDSFAEDYVIFDDAGKENYDTIYEEESDFDNSFAEELYYSSYDEEIIYDDYDDENTYYYSDEYEDYYDESEEGYFCYTDYDDEDAYNDWIEEQYNSFPDEYSGYDEFSAEDLCCSFDEDDHMCNDSGDEYSCNIFDENEFASNNSMEEELDYSSHEEEYRDDFDEEISFAYINEYEGGYVDSRDEYFYENDSYYENDLAYGDSNEEELSPHFPDEEIDYDDFSGEDLYGSFHEDDFTFNDSTDEYTCNNLYEDEFSYSDSMEEELHYSSRDEDIDCDDFDEDNSFYYMDESEDNLVYSRDRYSHDSYYEDDFAHNDSIDEEQHHHFPDEDIGSDDFSVDDLYGSFGEDDFVLNQSRDEYSSNNFYEDESTYDDSMEEELCYSSLDEEIYYDNFAEENSFDNIDEYEVDVVDSDEGYLSDNYYEDDFPHNFPKEEELHNSSDEENDYDDLSADDWCCSLVDNENDSNDSGNESMDETVYEEESVFDRSTEEELAYSSLDVEETSYNDSLDTNLFDFAEEHGFDESVDEYNNSTYYEEDFAYNDNDLIEEEVHNYYVDEEGEYDELSTDYWHGSFDKDDFDCYDNEYEYSPDTFYKDGFSFDNLTETELYYSSLDEETSFYDVSEENTFDYFDENEINLYDFPEEYFYDNYYEDDSAYDSFIEEELYYTPIEEENEIYDFGETDPYENEEYTFDDSLEECGIWIIASNRNKNLVIHISHPHGQSKQVTFGEVDDKVCINNFFYHIYTAPTCFGSSGGPTFLLYESQGWKGTSGVTHCAHYKNELNRGAGNYICAPPIILSANL